MTTRTRLSEAALRQAQPALAPTYDRSAAPTIVHLGVGAFARAHLGVYADDLLRCGWPATIRGVSLRTNSAEQQLAPQGCLYSVTEREAGAGALTRVIGSLTSVTTGVEAAIDAVADPATTMVTLTVTEKGNEVGPDDLAAGERPRSAPATLALALVRRRATGAGPLVVVSLDNILDNGHVLRRGVLQVAARLDATLPDWISEEVRFPGSVVDRMVPATTEHELDAIAEHLGLLDLAAVTAEHHCSWVLEDVDGLPPFGDVGAELVGDLTPYQRRKLWLLNGPHSAIAYAGLLAGETTIASAAVHPAVSPFVQRLVEEILIVADLPERLTATDFAHGALRRFRNPALGHTCVQVGADGSRKIPQRLLPVVAARRRSGLTTERFALVVATWIAAAAGIAVSGVVLPAVDDPTGEALRDAAGDRDLHRLVRLALDDGTDDAFVDEVSGALLRLVREGSTLLGEWS